MKIARLLIIAALLFPKALAGSEADEKALVRSLEGFRARPYLDTKGILTSGVGQTGPFRGMTFHEAFKAHKHRAIARFPKWGMFRNELRAHLIAAEYRGSLGLSPKTVWLINEERWKEAAVEFLLNDEYLDPATPVGIKKRMADLARLLRETV